MTRDPGLRYLVALVRGRRRRLAAIAGATLAATGAALGVPLVVRAAIDGAIAAGDAGSLHWLAAVLAAVVLAGAIAEGVSVAATARLAQDALLRAREDGFAAVQRRTVAEVERARRGDALAALTADVDALSRALGRAAPELVRAVALLAMATVVLLVLSPLLAAVALAGLPLVALAGRSFLRRSRVAYAELRARTADVVGAVAEDAHGAPVARAFARVPDRRAALAAAERPVLGAAFAAMWARNILFPAVTLGQGLATVAVVGAGGALAVDGRISVGTLAAFVLALASLFGPVAQLSELLDGLLAGRAALTRLAGLVDAPAGLPAPQRPVPLPRRGAIELCGVGFAYVPGRPVLQDVSLRVEPGERVALVGPTGAGKSTIARIACRLADPDAGVAAFGGVDLRDACPRELRRRVVLVAQEGHLVPGSVAENLLLARPGTADAEVRLALAAVGALDWALALPQGLETPASSLSAGQRQLLALARVALADPAAVILDEATSALDPGTELRVERAMEAVLADRAVLVIAHRPETAARCDRIVRVEGGRIAAVERAAAP